MILRIAILALIIAFVCAVYVAHAKPEEGEEKSSEDIIDDMIKNNVIDEAARGRGR